MRTPTRVDFPQHPPSFNVYKKKSRTLPSATLTKGSSPLRDTRELRFHRPKCVCDVHEFRSSLVTPGPPVCRTPTLGTLPSPSLPSPLQKRKNPESNGATFYPVPSDLMLPRKITPVRPKTWISFSCPLFSSKKDSGLYTCREVKCSEKFR